MNIEDARKELVKHIEHVDYKDHTVYVHGLHRDMEVLVALGVNFTDIDRDQVSAGGEGICGADMGNRFHICGRDNFRQLEAMGVFEAYHGPERRELIDHIRGVNADRHSVFVHGLQDANAVLDRLGLQYRTIGEAELARGEDGIYGGDAMGNRLHIVGPHNFARLQEMGVIDAAQQREANPVDTPFVVVELRGDKSQRGSGFARGGGADNSSGATS